MSIIKLIRERIERVASVIACVSRTAEFHLNQDIVSNPRGCSGGEKHDRDIRDQLIAHFAELLIICAEVMTPLRHAMRFVDHQPRYHISSIQTKVINRFDNWIFKFKSDCNNGYLAIILRSFPLLFSFSGVM